MKQYQRSVARFIDYLDEVGIAPHGAEEWDDMLVEFKNARALTKGQFANAVNGVEFFFPRYKPLKWSHRVSEAMAIEAEVEHTMPMLPNATNLIASRMAMKGFATVGAMLVLQVTSALRPSDAYRKLKANHIFIPSDSSKPAVIRLGAKTGTKVKREQFALIDQHEHPEVILLLKRWLSVTPPEDFMCNVGYDKVNALLKEVCRELGLNFFYTPLYESCACSGGRLEALLAGKRCSPAVLRLSPVSAIRAATQRCLSPAFSLQRIFPAMALARLAPP